LELHTRPQPMKRSRLIIQPDHAPVDGKRGLHRLFKWEKAPTSNFKKACPSLTCLPSGWGKIGEETNPFGIYVTTGAISNSTDLAIYCHYYIMGTSRMGVPHCRWSSLLLYAVPRRRQFLKTVILDCAQTQESYLYTYKVTSTGAVRHASPFCGRVHPVSRT
jgi:hypothetical protein